jgi:hypothetical protein
MSRESTVERCEMTARQSARLLSILQGRGNSRLVSPVEATEVEHALVRDRLHTFVRRLSASESGQHSLWGSGPIRTSCSPESHVPPPGPSHEGGAGPPATVPSAPCLTPVFLPPPPRMTEEHDP